MYQVGLVVTLLALTITILIGCALTVRWAMNARARARLANDGSLRARDIMRWDVTLWGERTHQRIRWADERWWDVRAERVSSWTNIDSLATRLGSYWVTASGYRRVWLRRLLYGIALVPWQPKRIALAVARRATMRWHQWPGKFEGNTSQAIGQYLSTLDVHLDYGSTDEAGYWAVILGPFPFGAGSSPIAEAALVSISSNGFFDYSLWPDQRDAIRQFDDIVKDLDSWFVDENVNDDGDWSTCDLCGESEWHGDMPADWNGDTGNHRSCEESAEENRRYDQWRDDQLTDRPLPTANAIAYTSVTFDDWVMADQDGGH